MLDEGYADIFSDNDLSIEDKEIFAKVYKEFAITPLLAPMTRDICLYLSAVHSRDGIKLPPYRALHHWVTLVDKFKTDVEEARYDFPDHSLDKAFAKITAEYERKGIRETYPDKDPAKGTISDIPDAVMIIPKFSFDQFSYMPHTSGVDLESAEGCLIDSRLPSTKIPFKLAKRMFDTKTLAKLGDNKNSDLVHISGFNQSFNLHNTFTETPKDKPVKLRFSKRSIKKVSRAKGQYKVVERGRTSLDKPSFGPRTSDVNLALKIKNEIPCIYPSIGKVYEPFLEIDEEAANAYEIDELSVMAWEDYDGLEHALKAHDDAVAINTKWEKHIYFYGGAQAFESLMRWGVLNLNTVARRNTMMILKRTQYFSTIGLFRLDDKRFVDFVTQRLDTPSFEMADFVDTKSSVKIMAEKILPMPEYRSYKAKVLLSIRQARNENRKTLKAKYNQFLADPVNVALSAAEKSLNEMIDRVVVMSEQYSDAVFTHEHNLFDSTDLKWAVKNTYLPFFRLIFSYTQSLTYFYELLPKSVVKKIKNDMSLRQQTENLMHSINQSFVSNFTQGIDNFIYFIDESSASQSVYMTDTIHLDKSVVRNLTSMFPINEITKTTYSLKDVPAAASFDIQW